MNKRKTTLSLLLVFSLICSFIFISQTTQAKSIISSSESASISVRAPYELYYHDDYGHYEYNFAYLNSDMLSDDFGIGLPADGKPDIIDADGDGEYSLMRLLASYVRTYLMHKLNLYPSDMTDDKALKAAYEKANKLMPNYMDIQNSEYGVFLKGLSVDGKNWNPGIAKAGTDAMGSWMVYIDGEMSALGLSSIPVRSETKYDIAWVTYADDAGYGFFSDNDKNENSLLAADEVGSYTVNKRTFDWNSQKKDKNGDDIYASSSSPVSGCSVQVMKWDGKAYVPSNIELAATDENGNVQFTSSEEGDYMLLATQDFTDGSGNTISKITSAQLYVSVVVAKAPKKIKVKASKKRKIKITVVNPVPDYADMLVDYTIYLSKNKSKGYKKIGTCNGFDRTVTTKKMKKGTYYIKAKTAENYIIGGTENNPKYKTFYSDFSKPVKVKVK